MEPNRAAHTLTEFQQNTPVFLKRLKDTGEPVTLTIDGKAELVVLDAASYQRLLDLAESTETIKGIQRGLEDVAAGRTQPIADAFAEIRRDLDLPPDV